MLLHFGKRVFNQYCIKPMTILKFFRLMMAQMINQEKYAMNTHQTTESTLFTKIMPELVQLEINEHVNDHHVLFARAVKERYSNLIAVEDIEKLGEIIKDYDKLSAGMHGGGMDNNAKFCEKFEELANELVGKGKK